MLIKKIKYIDFLGKEREEEFYFNYSKSDVNRLVMSTKEGLEAFLQRIVKEEDRSKMFTFLEEFILKSYGEVSDDGRAFIHSEEKSTWFSQTNAYAELLDEMIAGGDEAISDFVAAVLPKEKKENEPATITDMPATR